MTTGHAPELPCLCLERERETAAGPAAATRGAAAGRAHHTCIRSSPHQGNVNEMMTGQGAEGRSSLAPTAPNDSSVKRRRKEEATFAAP